MTRSSFEKNIFRHIELGSPPEKAARDGTAEVRLAVIATTLTVIAVFGPVAFLKGVVGQFFKQFGGTICFVMAISLFDALTIAPMLSAYFAGSDTRKKGTSIWDRTIGRALEAFGRFQDRLENRYEKLLRFSLHRPLTTLAGSFVVFFLCMVAVTKVPKTFLPPQESGEFSVDLDLPPGTNLAAMDEVALNVEKRVRGNTEVKLTALTVGNRDGEANTANLYVSLIPAKKRKLNTSQMKDLVR